MRTTNYRHWSTAELEKRLRFPFDEEERREIQKVLDERNAELNQSGNSKDQLNLFDSK